MKIENFGQKIWILGHFFPRPLVKSLKFWITDTTKT